VLLRKAYSSVRLTNTQVAVMSGHDPGSIGNGWCGAGGNGPVSTTCGTGTISSHDDVVWLHWKAVETLSDENSHHVDTWKICPVLPGGDEESTAQGLLPPASAAAPAKPSKSSTTTILPRPAKALPEAVRMLRAIGRSNATQEQLQLLMRIQTRLEGCAFIHQMGLTPQANDGSSALWMQTDFYPHGSLLCLHSAYVQQKASPNKPYALEMLQILSANLRDLVCRLDQQRISGCNPTQGSTTSQPQILSSINQNNGSGKAASGASTAVKHDVEHPRLWAELLYFSLLMFPLELHELFIVSEAQPQADLSVPLLATLRFQFVCGPERLDDIASILLPAYLHKGTTALLDLLSTRLSTFPRAASHMESTTECANVSSIGMSGVLEIPKVCLSVEADPPSNLHSHHVPPVIQNETRSSPRIEGTRGTVSARNTPARTTQSPLEVDAQAGAPLVTACDNDDDYEYTTDFEQESTESGSNTLVKGSAPPAVTIPASAPTDPNTNTNNTNEGPECVHQQAEDVVSLSSSTLRKHEAGTTYEQYQCLVYDSMNKTLLMFVRSLHLAEYLAFRGDGTEIVYITPPSSPSLCMCCSCQRLFETQHVTKQLFDDLRSFFCSGPNPMPDQAHAQVANSTEQIPFTDALPTPRKGSVRDGSELEDVDENEALMPSLHKFSPATVSGALVRGAPVPPPLQSLQPGLKDDGPSHRRRASAQVFARTSTSMQPVKDLSSPGITEAQMLSQPPTPRPDQQAATTTTTHIPPVSIDHAAQSISDQQSLQHQQQVPAASQRGVPKTRSIEPGSGGGVGMYAAAKQRLMQHRTNSLPANALKSNQQTQENATVDCDGDLRSPVTLAREPSDLPADATALYFETLTTLHTGKFSHKPVLGRLPSQNAQIQNAGPGPASTVTHSAILQPTPLTVVANQANVSVMPTPENQVVTDASRAMLHSASPSAFGTRKLSIDITLDYADPDSFAKSSASNESSSRTIRGNVAPVAGRNLGIPSADPGEDAAATARFYDKMFASKLPSPSASVTRSRLGSRAPSCTGTPEFAPTQPGVAFAVSALNLAEGQTEGSLEVDLQETASSQAPHERTMDRPPPGPISTFSFLTKPGRTIATNNGSAASTAQVPYMASLAETLPYDLPIFDAPQLIPATSEIVTVPQKRTQLHPVESPVDVLLQSRAPSTQPPPKKREPIQLPYPAAPSTPRQETHQRPVLFARTPQSTSKHTPTKGSKTVGSGTISHEGIVKNLAKLDEMNVTFSPVPPSGSFGWPPRKSGSATKTERTSKPQEAGKSHPPPVAPVASTALDARPQQGSNDKQEMNGAERNSSVTPAQIPKSGSTASADKRDLTMDPNQSVQAANKPLERVELAVVDSTLESEPSEVKLPPRPFTLPLSSLTHHGASQPVIFSPFSPGELHVGQDEYASLSLCSNANSPRTPMSAHQPNPELLPADMPARPIEHNEQASLPMGSTLVLRPFARQGISRRAARNELVRPESHNGSGAQPPRSLSLTRADRRTKLDAQSSDNIVGQGAQQEPNSPQVEHPSSLPSVMPSEPLPVLSSSPKVRHLRAKSTRLNPHQGSLAQLARAGQPILPSHLEASSPNFDPELRSNSPHIAVEITSSTPYDVIARSDYDGSVSQSASSGASDRLNVLRLSGRYAQDCASLRNLAEVKEVGFPGGDVSAPCTPHRLVGTATGGFMSLQRDSLPAQSSETTQKTHLERPRDQTVRYDAIPASIASHTDDCSRQQHQDRSSSHPILHFIEVVDASRQSKKAEQSSEWALPTPTSDISGIVCLVARSTAESLEARKARLRGLRKPNSTSSQAPRSQDDQLHHINSRPTYINSIEQFECTTQIVNDDDLMDQLLANPRNRAASASRVANGRVIQN